MTRKIIIEHGGKTLDDETASRIADETWAKRGKRHTVSGEEYVKAGYAARDAEVEELRAERDEWKGSAGEWADAYADAADERDVALATIEKVREWAEGIGKWDYDSAAAARIRAILDESPTERETPADDMVTIPRPVVPFGPHGMSEDEGTAHYLGEVVRKIDTGFLNVGGSNVTATVRKLLLDAAAALGGGSR